MKGRIILSIACLGWFALARAADAVALPSSTFLTKDWLLGGLIGVLQIVAVAKITKVDKKLDKHDERINAQDVRLAQGEGRMNTIERLCVERHQKRENDPPGFNGTALRCNDGQRKT